VNNPNLYNFPALCKLASEFTTIFVQTVGCSTLTGVMSIFAVRKLINIYDTYAELLRAYLEYTSGCEILTGITFTKK
jgi:hypothetical protein